MNATATNDTTIFAFERPASGWHVPGAKRRLEDRMLLLSTFKENIVRAYQEWRKAVESRKEPFSLATRNDYYAQMRLCLEAWTNLNAAALDCEKVVPYRVLHLNNPWRVIPYELKPILAEDWVPASRISDLYDDDEELSEENAEFFRAFDANRKAQK